MGITSDCCTGGFNSRTLCYFTSLFKKPAATTVRAGLTAEIFVLVQICSKNPPLQFLTFDF
ncbi:hypothetical protein [Chroococcidiopsis sp. SAG 2025]|uniref:hypothetical protein n=1 Tax=Chroococcidiopsis sp. SAG 2025 TaxID=171389 RepID=UPI0029372B6F|nr:hypothetical protein [Chroococcidiopsis sp. SAG 2025]